MHGKYDVSVEPGRKVNREDKDDQVTATCYFSK
jgi:hypothetical protein